MNLVANTELPHHQSDITRREWLASIDLVYQHRRERSVLISSAHRGPLRVQKPFYPEQDGTCHTYLLHPPGGMAVGDQLSINATCQPNTSVLLTTPSAGKMYGMIGVNGAASMPQVQHVHIDVDTGAICEWLPQETIIFNGANARLNTTIHVKKDAQFIGWDIIRLGRAASGECFELGQCRQKLRLYRDDELEFIELNPIVAGSRFQRAACGLKNKNTVATMLATVILNRDQIDDLVAELEQFNREDGLWGLTQKDNLCIARYLGDSIMDCRAGFTHLWKTIRPLIANKDAVEPRIWNT